MRRALLIVNPAARRASRLARLALDIMHLRKLRVDVAVTDGPSHAYEIAHESTGYDAFFSLGGDGTAIEVIDGAAASGTPVAVLPGGTGNLVARALGIPLGMERAVDELIRGGVRGIDLGRLDSGRRFVVGAGAGIDAAMIATTSPASKRRFGVAAYIHRGAVHALRRERFAVRVTVDGTVTERDASAVLVVNFGILLNGLISLGPGISPDDGVLNVCLFDPRTAADALGIAMRLLVRDFRDHSGMTFLSGSNVSIETVPQTHLQADGELLGRTPFTATVEPLAARLLVPQSQGYPTGSQVR